MERGYQSENHLYQFVIYTYDEAQKEVKEDWSFGEQQRVWISKKFSLYRSIDPGKRKLKKENGIMDEDILRNIWPEWETIKQIGRGTFGRVYEAVRREYQMEIHAAVKVISIPLDQSEIASLRLEGLTEEETLSYLRKVVDEFLAEIQIMDSFKGVQNIVSIEDYKVVERQKEIGWDIYIRMELLTPLNSYIAGRELSEREVIRLGCDICTALEICEKRNVIHRDVKPENIFVNTFGNFKLGDFGIARRLENLTAGMSRKGTFSYMAPEVEKGLPYDARVDIYSLGLVLYRLLNRNRLPFLTEDRQLLSPNERMNAVRRRMSGEPIPPPCGASPEMARLLLCACAYEPNQRFVSASAMKHALLHIEEAVKKRGLSEKSDKDAGEKNKYTDRTVYVRKAASPELSPPKSEQSAHKAEKRNILKTSLSVFAATAAVCVILFAASSYILHDRPQNGNDQTKKIAENTENKTQEDGQTDLTTDQAGDSRTSAIAENTENETQDNEQTGGIGDQSEQTAADKEEILSRAEAFKNAGDYASAIELLDGARSENSDISEYQSTYEAYCAEFKNQTVLTADNRAAAGDYEGAIQKIGEASSLLEEDQELSLKVKQYTDEQIVCEAETHVVENPQPANSQAEPSPFYGIWCYASKSSTEARAYADSVSQKGFQGQVFATADWSNLNSEEWYVVTAGTYFSEEEAKSALAGVQAAYPEAYVKYSGSWQGGAPNTGTLTAALPDGSSDSVHPPFYGIWCAAFKNQADAQSMAAQISEKGFEGQVFLTTDWNNLNPVEWYVVTAGVYSAKEAALGNLQNVRKFYPDAYIKYSGNWLGQ